MDFTAFNEYMVCEDPIKRYGTDSLELGYEFQVRYPTYRGAYVCNIEEMKITVDGCLISQKELRFGVNGKWFLMEQIRELFSEYWFTGKKATIRVLDENGITDGVHTITLEMKHKIPYTGYFGNYLVVDSKCTKKLCVDNKGEMNDGR